MTNPALIYTEKPLTKPQVALLTKALRNDGVALVRAHSFRTAYNLEAQDLVTVAENEVRPTRFGLRVLRDYRSAIWGKRGSMASLADLEEVEAAIAQVSA